MTTPNNTEHANIAVITGASSGLGEQFYETIAHRYPDIDEIWLIARRKERLEALAERFMDIHAHVRAMSFDLAQPSSYEELSSILAEEQPVVRVLINNAGFEREGLLRGMAPKDILAMIDLNIMGMTMVNRVFLPYMRAGSFEVITGSVSSFAPIPWQTAYSASKAYTRFLARALHEEERKRGVNVLLMSPGNMNTEMNVQGTSTGKLGHLPYLDLKRETARTLMMAERGHATYTPMLFYKLYRAFAKLMPSALAVKVTSFED
ncbi:short-chain dehydrogenase [Bifidobacterium myosotis]|uniref:Short-chain dehydrogenase n=1 Tax=Bifidobacterium myosotis TaxID=1630166 RepID=A0A261FDD2_9BIFI|nr:SDR family NAD(P)-dependent oxidoreductase [Bifidobacterium myosotis]OZG57108.1 short-chain dehydrogenase [Bifidobacterium myosotis]